MIYIIHKQHMIQQIHFYFLKKTKRPAGKRYMYYNVHCITMFIVVNLISHVPLSEISLGFFLTCVAEVCLEGVSE